MYVGRFAPSPTGPLHLGSLFTAVASYLDAKTNEGRWLVRIDDLDPPREMPGAPELILNTLEKHGLYWDGEVVYQSQRHHHYQEAIDSIMDQGLAFYCTCTRKALAALGGPYPGKCRTNTQEPVSPSAIRVQVNTQLPIHFDDQIQGYYEQDLANTVGDFIIRRKDGLYGYHIACVVDDYLQQITHVIRGLDLQESTPRQIYLQHLLHFPQPCYGHLPVIVGTDQHKLSKQSFALGIQDAQASENLVWVLTALGFKIPQELKGDTCERLLQWAIPRWHLDLVKGRSNLQEPSIANGQYSF